MSAPLPRAGLLGAVLAASLLVPASAANAAFTVTPSTAQAGAPAKVDIHADFAQTPSAVTLHLPPGLVGNPTPFSQCSEGQFNSGSCPAGSQVGTAGANGGLATGGVYNLVPHAGEPARLGISVGPLGIPADFNEAAVTLRPDGGLDSTIAPFAAGGTPVSSIDLSLGSRFMTMPTSCGPAATRIDAPPNASQSATFTPTGCAAVPFAPQLAATLDARGPAGARNRPAFTTVLTIPPGNAAASSTHVTLPDRFGLETSAIKGVCSLAQQAADSCPDASRVGSVTAQTPLLGVPLSGPVYLAAQPGQLLPGLRLVLGGPVQLRLNGGLSLAQPLVATFDGIPDVPLSRLLLTFDGGGPLKVLGDPCTGSVLRTTGALTGHNGASVTAPARVLMLGCPVRAGARRSAIDVRAGRDAAALTALRITLPNRSWAGKRVAITADGHRSRGRVRGRTITLALADARHVVVRLGQGRRRGRIVVLATRVGGGSQTMRLRAAKLR